MLRVALDAGDEGVGEGVRLGAVVERLDDHALLAGIAAPGDDLFAVCERGAGRGWFERGFKRTTTRPTLRLQRNVSLA